MAEQLSRLMQRPERGRFPECSKPDLPAFENIDEVAGLTEIYRRGIEDRLIITPGKEFSENFSNS